MDTATQPNTDGATPKPAENQGATPTQQSNPTPPQEADHKDSSPPNNTPPNNSPTDTPPEKKSGGSKKLLSAIAGIVLLVFGLGLGYVAASAKPVEQDATKQEVKKEEITLPSDAVQIQACANNKGTLYVKPENIPVGPIYMVHNKKVIGIEFMLGKDDFIAGKSFKFLEGFSMKVDHVNLGLLSQGHEGFPAPHYHVDMYLVDKEYESKIVCPNTTAPSVIPSAGVSATPSGVVPSIAVTQTEPSPTPTLAPSIQP